MNLSSFPLTNKLLFIGPRNIHKAVKNSAPTSWEIISVNSLSEFLVSPINIDFILDASIKDKIDLNLKPFSEVKIVACASTGTNHIKLPLNNSRQVTIISLRDIPEVLNKLTSAAEFSFGLLIALVRNLVPAAKSVESGVWSRSEFPGVILKGKKLGLIGFGRIGSLMANYATSFGLETSYYDPYLRQKPPNFYEHKSIQGLVSESDFISLHVPYDSEINDKPIITKEVFMHFKYGSFFINTSRGELIDEIGLIDSLNSGSIKGAALDVVNGEPEITDNAIYKYAKRSGKNIILTPHIAGNSLENIEIAATGILDLLVSKTLGI
jgi:phosphoglycerate dehydrogenase-like enzyme